MNEKIKCASCDTSLQQMRENTYPHSHNTEPMTRYHQHTEWHYRRPTLDDYDNRCGTARIKRVTIAMLIHNAMRGC